MSSQTLPSLSTNRKRSGRITRSETLAFYLFASPWLIGLVCLTIGPMIASLVLSFADYPVITPAKWVGLANYVKLFTDDKLVWQSLKVTLLYSLGSLPLILCSSFLVAILLNQGIRGVRFYRTIYYLPAVISGVPVAVLWMWMLSPQFGLINNLLATIGIKGPDWFFSKTWVLPSFMLMGLWGMGVTMVIFLAGLQDIPAHLYEAAEIDGANKWQLFRHVTVPLLSPITFYLSLIGFIGTFKAFNHIYVMQVPAALGTVETTSVAIFNTFFKANNYGYASAEAILLFIIILYLTYVQNRIFSEKVFYG